MKWFIVVLWSTIGADGKLDAYVFTQPSFETKEACVQHAMNPQEKNLWRVHPRQRWMA